MRIVRMPPPRGRNQVIEQSVDCAKCQAGLAYQPEDVWFYEANDLLVVTCPNCDNMNAVPGPLMRHGLVLIPVDRGGLTSTEWLQKHVTQKSEAKS